MKRLVEDQLPPEVLLKQGIYIQTCAHIERVLWHIVQLADGYDIGTAPNIQHYFKLKRKTDKLIEAVRTAVTTVPAPLAIMVASLIERVDAGRENRNMAAHGAWYLTREGKLRVEHYLLRPSPTGPVWHYVTQEFPMRQIDLALDDADRLLRIGTYLRDLLRARLLADQERRRIRCYVCIRNWLTA